MNEKIKNYLGLAVIAGIIIFALAFASYVRVYYKSIEPPSARSFSVSGEGKLVVIPDVAQFSFSVIVEGGKDIAKLYADNTAKVNKAIDFLKSKGIEAKDIQTQSYNLDPRYQYFDCSHPESSVKPCPPPEIVGYTITQTVLVKVRDFSKIGEVFSGVISSGVNSVSQLSFSVDNPDSFKTQAREQAIAKAKEKARAIAKAAGVKLGHLISIDESGATPFLVYSKSDMGFGGGAMENAPAPSVEPGSQEVVVDVTLRYEIK